jgi:hypothetical protein
MALDWYHVEGTTSYSSFAAAQTAASGGDTIQVSRESTYDTGLSKEAFDLTKVLTVEAVDDGICLFSTTGFSCNPGTGNTATIKNLSFYCSASAFAMTDGGGIFDRVKIFSNFLQCATSFDGITATNSVFVGIQNEAFRCAVSSTMIFYHCVLAAVEGATGAIYINNAGVTASLYNCALVHPTPRSGTGGTIYQDYNLVAQSWTDGGGGAGSNNVVDATGMGFAQNDSGSIFDYRILLADEVAGTTTANSVDLTGISNLDNDIDGRSRSTYGYKIGISAGYEVGPFSGGGGTPIMGGGILRG